MPIRRMGPLEAVNDAVTKFLPGHRPSKMGKLLKNADGLPQPQWAQNLMEYLLKKDDFTILETCLEGLDASNIPAVFPTRMENRATSVRITVALEALRDLQPLLVALDFAPESPALDEYSKRCWDMVTESWPGVLKWIAFLLADASGFTNSRLVVSSCSYLLLIIASTNDKNQYFKEELMANPGSVRVVCTALCQIDPRSKSHYQLTHTPDAGVVDIQTLEFCTSRQISLQNMRALFIAHPKTQREPMLKMFLKRAEELQTRVGSMNAASLQGTIQDLSRLCRVLSQLFGNYYFHPPPRYQRILSAYPAALLKWCEKSNGHKVKDTDIWEQVADCIGSLVLLATRLKFKWTTAVGELVRGGILPCIAWCTPHVSTPLAKNALRSLLGHLYPQRILEVAISRKDDRYWEAPKLALAQEDGDSVYHEYRAFFQRAKDILSPDKDRAFNVCAYIKNGLEKCNENDPATLDFKTCSACRAVLFCSEECQRKYWINHHSNECSALSEAHRVLKSEHAWPSPSIQHDQLKLVESFANANLPSPPELTPSQGIHHHPSYLDRWILLDFYSQNEARMFYHDPRSEALRARVEEQIKFGSASRDMFETRIEEGSDMGVYAEAKFRLNACYGSSLVVKLQYTAGAQEGERYRVIGSRHSIVGIS